MNALTRFDPFRDFWPELMGRGRTAEGTPTELRLDVSETKEAYEVKAEIPGAKKEDIHVRVEGNYVSISAERKQEREQKDGERLLLRELSYGAIARGFTLAHDIDDRAVVAKLEDGVLRLMLPKRQGSASKRIEIQ